MKAPAAPADILLVDDDPDTIRVLSRILAGAGTLRFATSGEEALASIKSSPPDLVLLDAQMPGLSGFQVCAALKADAALADVPVIFVTSHSEAAAEAAGLEAGAVDFIGKPVNPVLVQARVKTQLRLKRLSDELRLMSTTDSLTGVGNRRRFDDLLDREWRRATRYARPLSLLLIDIDYFKRYNDCYGHPAGDACLRRVADAMAGALTRGGDVLTRYGGEEFALLLPDTDAAGAEHVAHRLLDAVERLALAHEKSQIARHVTVSIGIGCFDERSEGWIGSPSESRFGALAAAQARPLSRERLVRAADRALYAAKGAGRAQAWALGIDDADGDAPAREVAPEHRPARRRRSTP